jgi:hypothetical protein
MKKAKYPKLEELEKLRDLQGMDGNWDYSEYMLGLFNGLEIAISVFTGQRPRFRTLPRKRKK